METKEKIEVLPKISMKVDKQKLKEMYLDENYIYQAGLRKINT